MRRRDETGGLNTFRRSCFHPLIEREFHRKTGAHLYTTFSIVGLPSAPAHGKNFIGFGASGSVHFNAVADLFADQSAGNGRREGNAPFFDIGFLVTDDLIGFFLFRVFIDQLDDGAEFDGITRQFRQVDHFGAGSQILKFGNAAFIVALGFLCGVVFGVFR